MSTIRVCKTKDYSIISNYHFKEKEMSLKAKGLLSLMLSLPDGWNYSVGGLVAICKENETAIKSALEELKEFGYLKVDKKLPSETSTGRIEYEYIVYEKKQDIEKQEVEKQGVDFLGVEFLGVVNNNNKKLNNKKLNNNINNIIYIVDYLNEKAKTKYKHGSEKTQKLINTRLKEGFSVEDFKTVIDKKCAEWRGTEFEKYLRPETLFGTKFENYLNAKIKKSLNCEREYDSETLNNLWDNIDDIKI